MPFLRNTTLLTLAAGAALFSLAGGRAKAAPPAAAPVSLASLVQEETDISRLPRLHDWVSNLQSSYDRTGGNDDSGKFLSGDSKEGGMADVDGPGAIVRIWSANPGGQIKIYIDGSPTPIVDAPFHTLFDGSLLPFKAGLTGKSSGGFYTYLPMVYARHCRIVLDNGGGVYYHVNSLRFAPGTPVRPFALPLLAEDQAALDAANAVWAGPPSMAPLPGALKNVRVGQTASLGDYHGAAVIRRITLAAPDASDDDLRLLVLRAYFDGHTVPDIQAPVADFFGNAFGRKPFRTLLLSCAEGGTLEADFPMPFARSARFTLENGTSKPIQVGWGTDVVKESFRATDKGYFHAIWTQEVTQRGKPHIWAHVANQRGRYVGVVQTMRSHNGIGYLEGDDQFRVDDQAWLPCPVKTTVVGPWNGTGTEDCFNSGWYFDEGPVSRPVHALLAKSDYQGDVDCLRWFLDDAPTFQKSLDGQIEHGGANDAAGVYYSSVAYWYSSGPVQPWFVMPPASQLALPKPLGPQFVIPKAMEGEDLTGAAKASAGHVGGQGMQQYGNAWSRSGQLFWNEGQKPGDTLTLTLTPPAAGTYDLVGYFTQAGDYGQVSFAINGKPLGTAFDGYMPTVVASGPVTLGSVTLPAGPSALVVTVTGKNEKASAYCFGLDALALNAPGSTPTPLPAPVPK